MKSTGGVVIDLDIRRASEAELAKSAKAGNDAAFQELARRLDPIVLSYVSKVYFAPGLTQDDLYQEGLIGLSEAVRDFRPDGGAAFRGFAEMCIKREVISAVIAAKREKHGPVNDRVALQGVQGRDGEELDVVEQAAFVDRSSDPHVLCAQREELAALSRLSREEFSGLEQEVFAGWINGDTYDQITERTGYTFKQVDNALQRCRRKLAEGMALAA